MKTSFTPGPWTIDTDRRGALSSHEYATIDGKVHCVAYITNVPGYSQNAHLIAAAPDLLDALKEAVENCPCSVRERLSGHQAACLAPEWEAAIAKAEGRE